MEVKGEAKILNQHLGWECVHVCILVGLFGQSNYHGISLLVLPMTLR